MTYNIKPIPVVILLAMFGAISWGIPVLSESSQTTSTTDGWGALPLNVQLKATQLK